eukprot:TRINITY_DN3373_c0_g1_i7.p1 TRINITY_DN3373_c0_g1~~TRINITY_DN3373_c0_g1_i7.p1  ORF type:complete len:480 (+),score=18.54 TRINITY_DN3373_c0_g1_i7:118-1557(+)
MLRAGSMRTAADGVAVKEIPGCVGFPIISPILDRVNYFMSDSPESFFKKRIEKYKSTVIRMNMPPGPPMVAESQVVMLLDAKCFPTLFDLSKVEKKNVLTGAFMPPLDFFGGNRVAVYRDPSEEIHSKLKSFCMELISRNSWRFFPEFDRTFDEFCKALELQLAEKGSAKFSEHIEQFIFNFICRAIAGVDPLTSLGKEGPSIVKRWLVPQLAPLASSGVLPKILDELTIHSIRLPFFLVKNDYNKLRDFFGSNATDALKVAQEFGISENEAVDELMFNVGFNAFGGMLIMFPSIIKRLASAGKPLHERLAEEVRKEFGKDGKFSMAGLPALKLVNSCVLEVLRMDPPVKLQYGRAKKDFCVESGSGVYKVKEGELLGGYQPLATKDPKVFDKAEEFVGDRFVKEPHLIAHVWWSNGPQTDNPMTENKQCAGKDVVVMTASLFVANFFLRYDSFSLDPDSSSPIIISLEKASDELPAIF